MNFPPLFKEDLYELQKGRCFYCGNEFAMTEMTRDHFIPKKRCTFLVKGGSFSWHMKRGNVVLACKPCNNDKSHFMPTFDHQLRYAALYGFRAPSVDELRVSQVAGDWANPQKPAQAAMPDLTDNIFMSGVRIELAQELGHALRKAKASEERTRTLAEILGGNLYKSPKHVRQFVEYAIDAWAKLDSALTPRRVGKHDFHDRNCKQ